MGRVQVAVRYRRTLLIRKNWYQNSLRLHAGYIGELNLDFNPPDYYNIYVERGEVPTEVLGLGQAFFGKPKPFIQAITDQASPRVWNALHRNQSPILSSLRFFASHH